MDKRKKAKKDEVERRDFPILELRVDRGDDEAPMIRGYAAPFNSWSENLGGFREKIAPGAFEKSIKKDDVRALFNHNPDHILGRTVANTLTLSEDDKGLYFEVDPPDTQYARDLMVSIDRGDISGCSFGFQVVKDKWNKDMTERELRECQLFDVSPVTYPAYPATTVQIRAIQRAGIATDELDTIFLKAEAGEDLSDEDQAAITTAVNALQGLNPPASEEVPEPEPEAVPVDVIQKLKLHLDIDKQL